MANIKKYNGSTWETTTARKYETKSEIIVPPTTIYTDGSNITTYTIKGNTVQNGTPTPSNPVDVVGVGELETSGEHSGDYKIPISSGGVTTNIYLGSTQTVRQIKKLVLNGLETWSKYTGTDGKSFFYIPLPSLNTSDYPVSTHWQGVYISTNNTLIGVNVSNDNYLRIRPENADTTSRNDFVQYIADQYAAGTPVTVWYVLATPETATVNEPLQKIGNYADTLSNAASIPTTEGANSITVGTTVQPSEFTATWTGWHNASVKIKLENLFDSTNAQSGYLTSTGTVVEGHQNLRYTDYLSIPSGISNITQSWTDEGATLMNAPSMCFYTDNKTFISGEEFNNSNPKTFSVPVGAAYVRTCFRTFYTDVILNEGDTPNWG